MKIAIPTDSGKVATHFGRAPKYTIVKIENREISEKKKIENPGHKPGYLPKFFNEKGIELMITSGIGKRAISLFDEFNIEIMSGVEGKVDEVIDRYIHEDLNKSKNPCEPGEGKEYGLERGD